MKTKMILCEYCIEALRSHGDKIVIFEATCSDTAKCEFCEETYEETNENLFECEVI